MDVDEFAKKVKPKSKKSQMEPFRAQILDLKKRGYADDQVKEWLALNGLVVSRQAVQQFVKKGANAIEATENKSNQTVTESTIDSGQTTLPKTGFHQVVADLQAQNSNSEPRRND